MASEVLQVYQYITYMNVNTTKPSKPKLHGNTKVQPYWNIVIHECW